jgi:Pvc16 N-terminal domain
MSNFLAIATVTATLQRLVQSTIQLDVPGARVTTVRPDSGGGTPEVGVNIYLYQAAPNPAWRNSDLRNRRPKGDLIKQAQAGLDLFYLFTFYGNETELEPQRLLGSAVRTLVDNPVILPDMIEETIRNTNFNFLQDSTLAEQIERVAIVPNFLSMDDLSKIWSVFFQAPYMLSFAFQGGAVLIEGDKLGGRGLPIRSRQFYATPNQPRLDRISAEHGSDIFIKDSLLLIRGQQLAAEVSRQQLQAEATVRQHAAHAGQGRWRRWQPKVLIGEAKITPQFVSDTEIRWRLSDLSVAELQGVRAGVQSVQVIYPLVRSLEDVERLEQSDLESERSSRTNAVPFVLLPQIIDLHVGSISRDDDQVVYAEITLEVDMLIGMNQKVFLFLNQMTMVQPAAYIFPAQRRSADGVIVSFLVREIVAGDYLVRIQVDGAESLLEIEGEAYGRPRLAIA